MEYAAPTTLKEAVAILGKPRSGACVVAGGTDVLPRVAAGKMRRPKQLVSISHLPGLDKISLEARGVLRIGARVTLAEVAGSKQVARRIQGLIEAASYIGSEQIRNTATLVGNICSASSAADAIPPLLCADAVAEVAGSKGRRRVPIDELLAGPRKLSLKAGELVLAVRIPKPKGRIGSAYRRHGPRRAMDCATVIAAAQVAAKKGQIVEARLAVGAVHPVPVRCSVAEALLAGRAPDDDVLAEAAEAVAADVQPISDIRASAEHRRTIVRRIVPEVVLEAFTRAGGTR